MNAARCLPAVVLSATLMLPGVVNAGEALVIDLDGTIKPHVELFDELEAGGDYQLEGDTLLTVAHYASCQEITISGGRLSVGENSMSIDGSLVLDQAPVECPAEVDLAVTDTKNASVVFRAMIPLTEVPLRPEIVVAGNSRGAFTELTVLMQEQELTRLAVAGSSVNWPSGAATLEPGRQYSLVLSGPTSTYSAQVIASDGKSGRVILRP